MWDMLAILGWYTLMSVVTFGAFALDKWLAHGEGRRLPENLLHVLEALGGWPGAFAAMTLVRHKSRKRSFQVWTVVIAALHIAGWLLYLLWWRRRHAAP